MKANSTGGATVSQPVCFYDIITVQIKWEDFIFRRDKRGLRCQRLHWPPQGRGGQSKQRSNSPLFGCSGEVWLQEFKWLQLGKRDGNYFDRRCGFSLYTGYASLFHPFQCVIKYLQSLYQHDLSSYFICTNGIVLRGKINIGLRRMGVSMPFNTIAMETT